MAVRRQCKDVAYVLQESGGGDGMSFLSLSLFYVSVCRSLLLYLCLLLLLFLFVRVTDILLTVEQGRGLPRTYRIYGCARGHPNECVDREVPPYIYGGGLYMKLLVEVCWLLLVTMC